MINMHAIYMLLDELHRILESLIGMRLNKNKHDKTDRPEHTAGQNPTGFPNSRSLDVTSCNLWHVFGDWLYIQCVY